MAKIVPYLIGCLEWVSQFYRKPKRNRNHKTLIEVTQSIEKVLLGRRDALV